MSGGQEFQIPYTLDDLASKAVKIAANPIMEFDNITGIFKLIPSDTLKTEMREYLYRFDSNNTEELIREVYTFIAYLINKFQMMGWYTHEGSSPYRFIGFNSVYTNTYDIVVRCG